jgi:hypothetical protein
VERTKTFVKIKKAVPLQNIAVPCTLDHQPDNMVLANYHRPSGILLLDPILQFLYQYNQSMKNMFYQILREISNPLLRSLFSSSVS